MESAELFVFSLCIFISVNIIASSAMIIIVNNLLEIFF
jgi:hypothetical protein